jgi:hypothetical protein
MKSTSSAGVGFALVLCLLGSTGARAEDKPLEPFVWVGPQIQVSTHPQGFSMNSRALKGHGFREVNEQLLVIRGGEAKVLSTSDARWSGRRPWSDFTKPWEGQSALAFVSGKREREVVPSLGAAWVGLDGGTGGQAQDVAIPQTAQFMRMSNDARSLAPNVPNPIHWYIFLHTDISNEDLRTFNHLATLEDMKAASKKYKDNVFVVVTCSWKAEHEERALTKLWKGTQGIDLMKELPAGGYIDQPAAWEKLWRAWRGKEELPKIDFEKEMVVVSVRKDRFIRSTMYTLLTKEGNLIVGVAAELYEWGDFGAKREPPVDERFSYHIGVINRAGVKSVGGKPLAK